MSSPTHDPSSQPPTGWGQPSPTPQPEYGSQPGYGAAPAKRPGQVTAAGVVGIVIGALIVLVNLLGLLAVGSLDVDVSALDVVVSIIAVVAGIALLVGGIQVLTGKSPKVLLYGAYALAAVWVIGVAVSLAEGNGLAGGGFLSVLGAAVVVGLLNGRQAKAWYGGAGRSA